MTNPWENDPIVRPAKAAKAPWENDPIVRPAGASGDERRTLADSPTEMRLGLEAIADRRRKGFSDKETGAGKAALLGLGQGAAMNWLDEVSGLANATIDLLPGVGRDGESWSDARARYTGNARRNLAQAAEDSPWAYYGGNIAGGIAGGLALPVPRLATAARTGMVGGGIYGGLAGAGEGDSLSERAANAGIAGAGGALAGGALGKAADYLGARRASREAQAGVRQAMARQGADAADEFGIPLTSGERSGDMGALTLENSARIGSKGEDLQGVAAGFDQRRWDAIENARRGIQDNLGPAPIDNPEQAGEMIAGTVGNVRDRAGSLLDEWGNKIREGLAPGRQGGDEISTAGEMIDNVRGARQRYANARTQAYNRASQIPGELTLDAMQGFEQAGLRATEGIPIEGPNKDLVQAALGHLRELSGLTAPNSTRVPLQPGDEIVGVSMAGIEDTRKKLTALLGLANQTARRGGDATQQYMLRNILNGFEQHVDDSLANGLFRGDANLAREAFRDARKAHQVYKQLFWSQGSGDDAGKMIEKIIGLDIQPEEVARALWGTATSKTFRGVNVRTIDRLGQMLGRDSPEFAAIRQGLWDTATRVPAGKDLRGEAQRIASALEEMVLDSGSARSMGRALYSQPEREGIARFAAALRSYGSHKSANDEGIRALMQAAQANPNPTKLVDAILGGSQKVGNTNSSWRLVEAVRSGFGEDSPQWGAIRQAAWQRMTKNPDGKDAKGAQAVSNNVLDFLNGKGRPVAERLFSETERKQMARFAEALRATIPPPNATNPSRSSRAEAAVNDARKWVMRSLGFMGGDISGAFAAEAVNRGLEKRTATRVGSYFRGEPIKPGMLAKSLKAAESAAIGTAKAANPVQRSLVDNAAGALTGPAFAEQNEPLSFSVGAGR